MLNCLQKLSKNSRNLLICMRSISSTTIYSLSSGKGKCGVSIIRVSGPQTKHALKAIVGCNFEPKARNAHLKALYHPQSGEVIDKGLVLWFPGPHSFTGEDCCEFQVHGSLAVISALLEALGQIPGLRTAAAGEFTKRAFFGGKLDLIEVEGLADLIHAETEAQRKQALLQSNGCLSRLYDKWRRRLIRCAAHLEAYIDFAEDENIEEDVVIQLTKDLQRTVTEIQEHLSDQRQGELLRDGIRTAIVGEPNVGKSSLLNLLCQRQVSIVTPLAGTTRDIIESTYNFGGYPVLFSDTAGLRKQTHDIIEQEGIALAKNCVRNADLILLLIEAKKLIEQNVYSETDLKKFTQDYASEMDLNWQEVKLKKYQLVANKTDLLNETEKEQLNLLNYSVLQISCKQQENLKPFLNKFEHLLQEMCGSPSAEHPRLSHSRYRQQLERCIEHINIFLDEYSPDKYGDMAIAAQKLRSALKCIERITGHVSTDDILDVVFKDFCIGK